MKLHPLAVLLLGLITAFASPPTAAETRIALVIGNGGYRHVAPLPNPAADARLMAHTLASLGFDVTLETDVDLIGMKQAIAEFGRKLRSAGPDAISLFYYAGHGLQAQGANYLVPVDAAILDEADLYLVGVEADWVLRQMDSARSRTSIVILDACRDNPFARVGLRDKGLARMDAPTGSFVAYSTAPGDVALDGDGANSPFTAALADEMTRPGTPIEQVFRQVRGRVLRATDGAQTPWDSSSLVEEFYFAGATRPPAIASAEEQLWKSVRDSGDLVELALFLRAYPNSIHAEEARRMLVDASTASPPPPPESPAPEARPAPPGSEEAMIAVAQASRDAADYRAYLDAYPQGTFAELARTELAALFAGQPSAPARPPDNRIEAAMITFDTPLPSGTREILGRSLAEIVRGTPLYPPIEGLPPELWQAETCASCHQWTKAALCTQGQFYTDGAEDRISGKKHPLGESFLRVLRRWAETGCN